MSRPISLASPNLNFLPWKSEVQDVCRTVSARVADATEMSIIAAYRGDRLRTCRSGWSSEIVTRLRERHPRLSGPLLLQISLCYVLQDFNFR